MVPDLSLSLCLFLTHTRTRARAHTARPPLLLHDMREPICLPLLIQSGSLSLCRRASGTATEKKKQSTLTQIGQIFSHLNVGRASFFFFPPKSLSDEDLIDLKFKSPNGRARRWGFCALIVSSREYFRGMITLKSKIEGEPVTFVLFPSVTWLKVNLKRVEVITWPYWCFYYHSLAC